MPEAESFATLGAHNGFASCVSKVDVSSYDHWTTLSGFNKDSGGSPTTAKVEESLALAMRLFWNLHKVTVYSFNDTSGSAKVLDDLIVNGQDWTGGTVDDAIEPKDRVCGGSKSTYLDDPTSGVVDVTTTTGILRLYDGVTTSETNFIGYGMGEIDVELDIRGSINSYSDDGGIVNALVCLGGYGYDPPDRTASGDISEVDYVVIEDADEREFNFLFIGTVGTTAGTGYTLDIDSATRTAVAKDGGTPEVQAEISSLDYWTYPE